MNDEIKILVLEDDDERIEQFKQRFEEYNIHKDVFVSAHFVKHAQEAINYIQLREYDILFLDHDLGGEQMVFDVEDCGQMVTRFITVNSEKVLGNPNIIIHTLNGPAGDIMERHFTHSHFVASNEDERFNVYRIPFIWMKAIFKNRML